MAQSTISARIDEKDKMAFDAFCSEVGLNTSAVINMFVKKVIRENRIPFDISLPQSSCSEVSDEELFNISDKIMNRNEAVYRELAK